MKQVILFPNLILMLLWKLLVKIKNSIYLLNILLSNYSKYIKKLKGKVDNIQRHKIF